MSAARNMVWLDQLRGKDNHYLFPRNIGIESEPHKIKQTKVYRADQYLVYLENYYRKKGCFTSLLSDYQIQNKIVDRIFIEFDEDDQLERSRKAKILYFCLKSLGITPLVLFSGGRSYHFHIFFEPIELDQPKKRMRKWVEGLPVDFLDHAVIGDVRRLVRIPYTIHIDTGKMCVIIPEKVLEAPVDQISGITDQLTRTWRDFINPTVRNNDIVPRGLLEVDIDDQIGRDYVERDLTENPPCVDDAIRELQETKDIPHMKKFQIAAFYNRARKPIEEVHRLFKEHYRDYKSSMTSYHLRRIYGRDMRCYGCETYIEAGACPLAESLQRKCPYWPSINVYL